MRILVIQTAFLGDVVLTTPFLKVLHDRWADAEIDVITTPAGAEALQGLPKIRSFALDKKRLGIIKSFEKLKAEMPADAKYEFIFCVHRSVRSLWIGKQFETKRRVAFSSFWSRLLGYEHVAYPAYHEKTHYADKPLALLRVLGIQVQNRPRPWLASTSSSELAEGFIAVSPFSVWGTKMWLADRFAKAAAEIARKKNRPIVLIGASGAKEAETARQMAEQISASGGMVTNLVGKTSVSELKGVIAKAGVLLANDSAPVHIAAAFNVPVVAIFGPTVKKWGFFPLSEKHKVVERTDLSCRPCHIHGPETCPKGHFKCMNEIQVEDVVASVDDLLRGGK